MGVPLKHPPVVDAQRSKVHPVLGLKDEGLGPDLHDGGRLHSCGDGKESQLSSSCFPNSLSVCQEAQALQPAVEV